MIKKALILLLFIFTGCTSVKYSSFPKMAQRFVLDDSEIWGDAANGELLKPGGFSGLHLAHNDGDEVVFWSITDRGPNGYSSKNKAAETLRPFLIPDFQPRILRLQLNRRIKTLKIVETIKLMDGNGHPITGLPPITKVSKNEENEIPVTSNNKIIKNDLVGIDSEGITVDDHGNFWICEEYRPAIMKFSATGKLLKSYIPLGTAFRKSFEEAILPREFKNRQLNRGFEGITFANGKIYAILQSPLETEKDQTPSYLRMIEIDPVKESLTGEFKIELPSSSLDKLGDLTYVEDENKFYFVLQNSKTNVDGSHLIMSFSKDSLVNKSTMVKVEHFQDLNKVGFGDFEKIEGLTYIGDKEWAVINDNDFNVISKSDGSSQIGGNISTTIGILKK